MKYCIADTWVNDDTITELPIGATLCSDVEWEKRRSGAAYPPTSFVTVKAKVLATYRDLREKFLGRIGGISADAQGKALPLIVAACAAFRQGLLDLPECAGVAEATTEAGLKAAIKTEYDRLVGLTDPALKAAFWKMDA